MSEAKIASENEPVRESFVFTPLPICVFRRAINADIDELTYLMTDTYHELFGSNTVEWYINRCFFSMVALNSEERIVALICLDDHPNVPALHPSEWEDWVKNLYSLSDLTPQNTLWVHLMICHPDYTYNFTKPLLEKIYLKFPLLIHLITVVPQGSPILCYIMDNFSCVLPTGYTNQRKVQTLYLTFRHQYIKKYKVRLAVEEDNDDLVPLIDAHSQLLKEMYGEYYICELLIHADEMDRQLIVAEIGQRAKAVVILNGEVNYDAIFNECNMELYGDLYEPTQLTCDSNDSSDIGDNIDDESIQSDSTIVSIIDTPVVPPMVSKSLDSMQDIFENLNDVLPNTERQVKKLDNPEPTKALSFETNMSMDSGSQLLSVPSVSNTEDTGIYDRLVPGFEKNMLALKSAFTLEVMASDAEHEDGVYCDLIEAAFQPFPTKEFCVLSISHAQEHFPLFNFFTRLIPRKGSIYPHAIYLLHKNAIKPKLAVHRLKKSEYKAVKLLIKNIHNCSYLLQLIISALFGENHEYEAFVMCNYETVIGLMIIKQAHEIEHLSCYYQINQFLDINFHKYDRHGFVEECVLSPIFDNQGRYFIREVHRLSDMSILLYKYMNSADSSSHFFKKPYIAILKHMQPVYSRRLPSFNDMHLEEDKPEYLLDPKTIIYTLLVSTPRLCSLKKVDVNSRIVIVGASSCAVSFLDALNMYFDKQHHVNFNNLTMVYDRSSFEVTDLVEFSARMFLLRGRNSTKHYSAFKNKVHVNYMYGIMKSINRRNKYITVTGNKIIPYDYLFLMCGQQFHHPYSKGVRRDKLVTACPTNVFVVNEMSTADKALRIILKRSTSVRKRTIVIYGGILQAYCCLATLQSLRMPRVKLILVEPNLEDLDSNALDIISIPLVQKALHDILDVSEVEVYRNYDFSEWQLNEAKTQLLSVKFLSRDGFITLPCDFMFCYANKQIRFETFLAIYNAGLVYDGKLVIDLNCRTNDPFIFAAGPMTKYSRKCFAEQFAHRFFNSEEIGRRLALHIRAMLLPGGLKNNKDDKMFKTLSDPETDKLAPKFIEPIMVYCILPGFIHYINIRSPGKCMSDSQKADTRAGIILETGNLAAVESNNDPKYCRITLDFYNTVSEITCFVKETVDVNNFLRIHGKHEKLLNNMLKRYRSGEIKDFYDFFHGSYFCAIYLDRFNDLEKKVNQIINLLTSEVGESLLEYTIKKFSENDWRKLATKDESNIKERFYKSDYYPMVAKEVIKYLTDNDRDLPMFAHPLATKLLLINTEESPLFEKYVR